MPKSKLERLTDYDQLSIAIIHFDEQLKKIDLSMLKPYKSTAMIQSYTGNSFDFVPTNVVLDFLVKNNNVEFTNPKYIT